MEGNIWECSEITNHGELHIAIKYVAKAAFPFFLLLVVAVAILISFPEIATFLPSKMLGSG